MANRFFYTIGIGFALGIFVQSVAPQTQSVFLLLGMVAFALGVAWRIKSTTFYSPLFISSLCIFSLTVGMMYLQYRASTPSTLRTQATQEVTLSGVVVREPDLRTQVVMLTVRDDTTNEKVLVSTDVFQTFNYGDVVSVTGEVTVPKKFETDLGRTFDYPGYLRARGIATTISFAEVSVLDRGAGNPVMYWLLQTKHTFMRAVESIIPEPQAGLGEGLLLGVKRALGVELETVFRTTGIIHIVVLSGYNIMLVAEAIMRLLALAFSLRVRVVLGVVAISLFALLVGFSATVVRASIMASLVLIARATGRTYAILRALLLAGVVMLLINPYLLVYDPGFQLSFLATIGLVVLAPALEARLGLLPTRFQLREFVTATIATQIMVLPLLLYLIGQFSVVAVAVNVLVLPMVPLAMLLTFLTGLLAWVPVIGVGIGYAAFVSLSYIIFIPELFAALPFAAFGVPAFSFVWTVVAYVALAMWLWYRATRGEALVETDNVGEYNFDDWTIVSVEKEPEETVVSSGSDPLPFR